MALRSLSLALVVLGLVVLAPISNAADRIVVGSKIDTEGALLGAMIVIELKHLGLDVEDRTQLGPTLIVRQALKSAQIDIYPEYTGNGAVFYHQEPDPAWRDPDRGYALIRKLDGAEGLDWLQPAEADNCWAIAVRRNLGEADHMHSLEDLAHYIDKGGRIRLAASAEFVESSNALPAFEAAYRFHLDADQILNLAGGDTSATIRAAAEGLSGVNAAMAYGTDGALAALGLILLDDDKHVQVAYRPAPVIRHTILAAHPEIETALDPVFRSLDQTKLQRLNAKIAVDGEDPASVAKDYLIQSRLLQ